MLARDALPAARAEATRSADVDGPTRLMAGLLRRGRFADEIVAILADEEATVDQAVRRAGRNDPCPCGSGRKTKVCHGRHEAMAGGAEHRREG